MAEKKEIKGTFKYEQDSKRFHRYRIEAAGGIVGTVYIPKDIEEIPEQIILEDAKELDREMAEPGFKPEIELNEYSESEELIGEKRIKTIKEPQIFEEDEPQLPEDLGQPKQEDTGETKSTIKEN